MNTFLFDLDGTLLPMDQEAFLEAYFSALEMKLAKYVQEPKRVIKSVWAGTMAMLDNDGSITNEQRYWNTFTGIEGEELRSLEPVFNEFYSNEFYSAKKATSMNPLARQCIDRLKLKGYKLALATNPLFPRVATINRIQWAGLSEEDFELITTYENSSYCKPNADYYKEILKALGKQPKECCMVGNDIREDILSTSKLGMQTFLLKDCMIRRDEDISGYRQGGFPELLEYIDSLPNINGL